MASLEGADALVPNSNLRVMAEINAGMGHLNLQFIAWLANQILPTNALDEWLDRWATIYLVNADSSKGRKQATFASGTATVSITATAGGTIDEGTTMTGGNGVIYQTTAQVSSSGVAIVTVPIVALTAGAIGNLDPGSILGVSGVVGANNGGTVVSLTGGTDQETNDQLRYRLLLRIQNPPMGGDANDYVQWTLAVAGVTRAWASPQEQGVGTMTVRFMCDTLRASSGGFPTQDDIDAVTTYLNMVRPVTVKDFFVESPIPFPISFTVADLDSNDATTWANILTSVGSMIFNKAAPASALNGVTQPATTIYAAWVSDAVLQAVGVNSFDLIADDFVMPNAGSLAVLGNVIHG
jgi:uncharacterized phage protein gp47/JayE